MDTGYEKNPERTWVIQIPDVDDAEGMAKMQAASWKVAYAHEESAEHNARASEDAEAYLRPGRIEMRKQLIIRAQANESEEFYRIAKNTEGKVIGLIYGESTDAQQELVALFIDEHYFSTSVSQALVDEFLGWCDPTRAIELGVAVDNHRAQAFYRKMGFRAVNGPPHEFNDYIEEIKMERTTEMNGDES
jgi:RimJ/RimL family protein N-acetyltransferase